jgi:UDP-glucose 4-epimerase
MKILVTGGGGYIGSRLVDRLQMLFRTWTITSLDKRNGEDLLSADALKPYEHYDKVLHLASHTSTRSIDPSINIQNVYMVDSLLQHFTTDQIVFSSSAAVYEPGNDLAEYQGKPGTAQSEYGKTKMECEQRLEGGVILRLFNVYGGGYGIVDLLMNLNKVVVYGDGTQVRDYVYIEQVLNSFIYAMQWARPGVYNIGTGVGKSVNDLIDMLGVHHKITYDLDKVDLAGVPVCTANITKAKKNNFPPPIPIEEVLSWQK